MFSCMMDFSSLISCMISIITYHVGIVYVITIKIIHFNEKIILLSEIMNRSPACDGEFDVYSYLTMF